MRVATNSLPNSLIQQLQNQQGKQLDLQTQLAKNQRISRASDDPLAFRQIQEIQSQQRGMRAYRANMDRATLVADLTESGLSSLKEMVRNALGTADLIETSIRDNVAMSTSANLLNDLLEQVLTTLNQKNDDQHLFSGSTITTEPFKVVRDENGFVSMDANIQYRTGDAAAPALIQGATYRIENNGSTSVPPQTVNFTAAGAASNDVGTVFTYNGGAIPWVEGGLAAVSQVAANITEKTASQLVIGKAYEIAGTPGANSKFTNSGAINNAVGTQFIYNGESPVWNGAELIPLQVADTELIQDPYSLATGKLYKIAAASANGEELPNIEEQDFTNAPLIPANFAVNSGLTVIVGTDGDYSPLGGPAAAVAGNVFTTNVAGTIPTGLSVFEAPLQAGKTYRIENLGTATDLTGISGLNPIPSVGEIFVSDGTQPTAWDGLQLKSLVLPTYDQTIAAGTTVQAGTTFQISAAGDFSAVGGPAAGRLGQVFTATTTGAFASGTVKELIPTLNEQDNLHSGESYVIGNLSASNFLQAGENTTNAVTYRVIEPGDYSAVGGAANMLFGQTFVGNGAALPAGTEVSVANEGVFQYAYPDALVVGQEYIIVDNGATADFTASGSPDNNIGTIFTANGTAPNFGERGMALDILTGETFLAGDTLVAGRQYRIEENSSSADFTASGATSNDAGTRFTYDGTFPSWGAASLQAVYPATDFTAAGAATNTSGTTFTSNGQAVAFGSGGTVFQYFPARALATNFTQSGAVDNNLGTVFAFNGTTAEFGSDQSNAGAVVAYSREKLAGAYVGSDGQFKFQIAEGKTMSPFNDGARNREFEALVNGLVQMRDAYQLAADADENDFLTRDVALERAKEAATTLGNSEERVLMAIADMGVTRLGMSIAENKDDKLYTEREDQKARGLDIDQAELITKLTNSLDAYQASLQSSARSLQISLMDYI